jgi:glucokinase
VAQERLILAGDIGGTKTYVGLFCIEGNRPRPVFTKKLLNSDFESIEDLVASFVRDAAREATCADGQIIYAAAFGVACPVEGDRCSLTNTPWIIDARKLAGMLGLESVGLMNDLEATGWGIGTLGHEDVSTINPGTARDGNAALIAAGTGLGEAILFKSDGQRRPSATEGGHADFAPRTELEMELLSHLMRKFGHVSYERVLSGDGLANIYSFLLEREGEAMPGDQKEAFERKGAGETVFEEARSGKNPLAAEALRIFVSIYGAEAGNLALKSLSTGGLYIGGGIAPKVFGAEEKKIFMEAFVQKGRFRDLLATMPVHLILNDKAGLMGAARRAVDLVE